jgi:hypothetical protein
MISHKHKCIFIHISKCAGTSIESAFGIDIKTSIQTDLNHLFGWDYDNQLYLQHATPQYLIDKGLISKHIWETYYKFIIVRNPWSRFHSCYSWLSEHFNLKGSFYELMNHQGVYKLKSQQNPLFFLEDHLRTQKDYFKLDGGLIEYDRVIKFENISNGLDKVIEDLNLPSGFFEKKVNVTKNKKRHYSSFYSKKDKALVEKNYEEDITFFNYEYVKQHNFRNLLKRKV